MTSAFGRDHRNSPNRLYRDRRAGRIFGVCAGIADYFGFRPLPVRLIAVLALILFPVPTLIAYVVAALVLERKPEDMYANPEEEAFWRAVRTEPVQTVGELRHRFRELERRLRAAERCVTSSEYKLKRQFRDLEG